MPRSIDVTVNPDRTRDLVARLEGKEHVLSVQVFAGASAKPAGDVLHLTVTDERLPEIMRELREGEPESLTLSRPAATFSKSSQALVNNDRSESVWEEAESSIRKVSLITDNYLMLMVISGFLATVGLATGALHIVVAAMLIAPGFEPITNLPFGLVLRRGGLVRFGAKSTLAGYGAFIAASGITFYILQALGRTNPQLFVGQPLVEYWTSFSASSFLVPIVASVAGIVVILMDQPVLTAGVMVALALIPGAAITGACLAAGQWEFALRGLGQWAYNLAAVAVIGLAVLWLKYVLVHKRDSWY
ncbi:MAG: DUF389 domain-containing protein [Armatimonadota bacterium]